MKYLLNQYPKFLKPNQLSAEQLDIRKLSISPKLLDQDKRICKKCGVEQPITEFYFAGSTRKWRKWTCRDCTMKASGTIEVGKNRFAEDIFKKGFKRCPICKDIKPLTQFSKHKGMANGVAGFCKKCGFELVREYQTKQIEELGDFHVRQYAIRHNLKHKTKKQLDKVRAQIIEKQTAIKIDGQTFKTLVDAAEKYGLSAPAVRKRLDKGVSMSLSKFEVRSKARTFGEVEVTDSVTGKKFKFYNTRDPKLLKMFSDSAITKAIKTGEKTRVTSLSKYKNPCYIKRL